LTKFDGSPSHASCPQFSNLAATLGDGIEVQNEIDILIGKNGPPNGENEVYDK